MIESGKRYNKILLIFPPTKTASHSHMPCVPPLGILYVASVLREGGYDVTVLDAIVEGYDHRESTGGDFVFYGLSFQDIEARIRALKPDVVGISSIFSSSFTAVKKICRIIKAIDAEIVTITGGAHPSFLPERSLHDLPELDFIVIGEGDYAVKELLDRLNSGKDLSGMDGVAYRSKEEIHVNAKTSYIEDLNAIPWPARDLVPIERYISINAPHGITSKEDVNMSVITSRGCPFNCIFCSSAGFWGKRYRMRSVESVLDEIEMLVKRYKAKEIQFLDDNLTLDKERAKGIFRGIIDRKLDISWNTPNGVAVWTLDEDMLRLMKKSGCYALTLAIESGDQDVLENIIKKPLDLGGVRVIVKLIKKMKIHTHAFFVVGFPGETPEQLERTFRFARELDLDSASFNIAQPLPGSELDMMMRRRIKKEFDYENITYLLSSYDTDHFKGTELENKIAKEFLKFNISLFYRHPLRFVNKFGRYILKNPANSLRLLFGFIRKAV